MEIVKKLPRISRCLHLFACVFTLGQRVVIPGVSRGGVTAPGAPHPIKLPIRNRCINLVNTGGCNIRPSWQNRHCPNETVHR